MPRGIESDKAHHVRLLPKLLEWLAHQQGIAPLIDICTWQPRLRFGRKQGKYNHQIVSQQWQYGQLQQGQSQTLQCLAQTKEY